VVEEEVSGQWSAVIGEDEEAASFSSFPITLNQ
jgi:hypothetical protein